MKPKRILVVDDHEVVRRGLKDILSEEFNELEVGEATTSDEASRLVAEQEWDLVLLDLLMPGSNSVQFIGEIKATRPQLPVLVLTAAGELGYAVRTLKAGANGFITKQYAAEELLFAVKKVLAGDIYISGETAKGLAATLRGDSEPTLPHEKLSPREYEIFCLIAKGKTVKEIASELSVSDKTVGTHLMRIREKTGLASHVEITRYALQKGLVD